MTVEKITLNTTSVSQCMLLDSHAELFQNLEPLLLILLPRHPEVVSVLHDVGKYGTTKEYHVLTTRGIFNTDFEFLSCVKGVGGGGERSFMFGLCLINITSQIY